MKEYLGDETLNVGSGEVISIKDLVRLVADGVGYEGELAFDSSKPDGIPRKLLDVSRLRAMGLRPKVGLREGIKLAYGDFASGKVRM